MYQLLMVLHVLVALGIIGLVMIQQGRGADAGAGFGGASNTLFGARGASSFLSRTTAILATVFFLTSLILAYMAGNPDNKTVDIMDVPQSELPKMNLPPVSEEQPSASEVPAPPATVLPPQGDQTK